MRHASKKHQECFHVKVRISMLDRGFQSNKTVMKLAKACKRSYRRQEKDICTLAQKKTMLENKNGDLNKPSKAKPVEMQAIEDRDEINMLPILEIGMK